MIAWCYPVAFWGLTASLLLKLILVGRGPRWLPLLGFAIALVPVQGMPLGRFLHGFTGNFSLPLFVLLIHHVAWASSSCPDNQTESAGLLSHSTERSLCLFGLLTGAILFPLSLGIGRFDPYSLGWSHTGPLALFALTALLLWRGHGSGYVLLTAAIAWRAGLLESTNVWDYVIDPTFCLISAGAWTIWQIQDARAARRDLARPSKADALEPQRRAA